MVGCPPAAAGTGIKLVCLEFAIAGVEGSKIPTEEGYGGKNFRARQSKQYKSTRGLAFEKNEREPRRTDKNSVENIYHLCHKCVGLLHSPSTRTSVQ
jgi:hypothetical protein